MSSDNANDAAPTNAQRGVVIDGGPRIGAQTIDAILCDAIVEVIGTTTSGRLIDYGSHHTLPPAVRRAVLCEASPGGVREAHPPGRAVTRPFGGAGRSRAASRPSP